ncbi:MAG: substrate-binding domain-containing protein [Nitrospirota bacterium]
MKSLLKTSILALFSAICLIASGCQKHSGKSIENNKHVLRLATSSTTVESGLIDRLVPVFEKKYGVSVEVLMVGSGESLNLARKGAADVVLIHSREAEDKFVTEGYGINRKDVMYNDYVILGPPEDPLKLKEEKDVLSAMTVIADKKAAFISRGDKSGTHARELILWNLINIKPSGKWYMTEKKDQLTMLRAASDQKAYVLSDRSTYLYNKESLNLAILVEGDRKLFNPYGVIAVSPAKVPGVNFETAMKFIDFITSVDGQEIICYYGKMRFNKALFTPLATRNYTCQ